MKLWTLCSITLRETVFKGYIVNTEPLRIGSGREPPFGSLVDLAVIRISIRDREVPYIPGSSLKGVFRSHTGNIVKSHGLEACSGLARGSCIDVKEVREEGVALRDLIERYMRENRSEEAMKIFFKNACLVCKIFGSSSYRGKVTFSDSYPLDENGNILPFKFGTRTGIAIDRRTGAVSRGALYTVEYVEPGCKFKFDIRADNLPNYALGLLSTLIKMVNSGEIKIGGFTSRGFGQVRIEDLEIYSKDSFKVAQGKVMHSLEEGVDEDLDVSNISEVKDGRLYFSKENAWKLIDLLEGVWNNAVEKLKGSEE
ncbi:CRISPR-associated RAMP protein [Candidatus Bathyarchaeota archaeon]|nr:CRISPR-associated RAMP protein [Candidatus Bathyarchaeota archaeon]MBS7613543.1 CRISPR-associated RAMP protein [Candidatus Bathyarchaeota archaeon]